MVTYVNQPPETRRIVDIDGLATDELNDFFEIITDYALIIGTGSPEGVITAPQGASYMNDAGTAGNLMWRKRDNDDGLGDASKGWIAY